MKKLMIVLFAVSMVGCYKPPPPEPEPAWSCNDVLVFKHHYVSPITYEYHYTMQWKRPDGTFYNMKPWADLYWSKVVGSRRCGQ